MDITNVYAEVMGVLKAAKEVVNDHKFGLECECILCVAYRRLESVMEDGDEDLS